MAKAQTKLSRPKLPKGVAPNYDLRVPTYYANFASVSTTMREVFIDFCLVAPPHNVDAENQLLQAPVVARVIATREFAQALNETLQTHLTKSEEKQKESQ